MSGAPVLMLDHVVIGAATLAQGVAWCRETFGIAPAGGGEHVFMATHNRVFAFAGPRFPRAYLEIIAVNPLAKAPGRIRWFELDRPDVRDALDAGPRLLHWVARCADVATVAAELRAQSFDPGPVLAAERATAERVLRWQITVPVDGRRQCQGAVPTLIEWGEGGHPTDTLPPSAVALSRLVLDAHRLGAAAEILARLCDPAIEIAQGGDPAAAPIRLELATPRGAVTLDALVLPR